MELLWNEFGVQRLIHHSTEQTEIEGIIPLPAEKSSSAGFDAAIEILDYSADVSVNNCRAEAGRLNVEGTIEVQVVAMDEQEKAFAFTSTSAFSYTVEAANVDIGMNIDLLPSIKSLSLRHAGGSQLMLNALIDLEFTVTSATPMKVLSGVSGVADMEMKLTEISTGRRVELASEIVRLGEEIASDGADDVLQYNAQISVRDTTIENGNASISGMITLNALCRNAEGELMQLARNIPFRESLAMNGSAEEIYTVAELNRVSVRALGTEFSLVSFDADVAFRVFGMRRGSLSVPVDAFSPTLNFNCLSQNLFVMNSEGGVCVQHSMRENLTVPEGMPDIFTALHASTHPVVTSVSFIGSEMQAEGLLMTRFMYRSGGNKLYSFTEDVPFVISMAVPAGTSQARLRVSAQPNVTGGGGRTAQIAYSIDASAELASVCEIKAIVGIAEANADCSDSECNIPRGIVIYNACEGETAFDIARRFRIPLSRIPELNKGIGDVLKEGEKVLLLV